MGLPTAVAPWLKFDETDPKDSLTELVSLTMPHNADPLVTPPRRERRAKQGTLRWVRDILGRPLTFEKRGLSLHVVLKDRRRRQGEISAEALSKLLLELKLRLAEVESPSARQALRHLATVYNSLLRKGWPGVGGLPSSTLAKAAVQAKMISGGDASARMRKFIEHLQHLQVAAEVREDRLRHSPPLHDGEGAVEVGETTAEAFEASEREWLLSDLPNKS